ncbi:MAG: hypothetical protein IKP77_06020 [Acholeplasmatales bacterium]|nr:hypothetical protein [Acholeplasmatales bacterium]
MSKEFREKLEKVLDILGEILAFVTAVVWALVIIDQNFSFLPTKMVDIFNIAKSWLLLALVGIVGLEATIKRNIIVRILFYLVLAVLIIFHCFPGTYDYLVGLVK